MTPGPQRVLAPPPSRHLLSHRIWPDLCPSLRPPSLGQPFLLEPGPSVTSNPAPRRWPTPHPASPRPPYSGRFRLGQPSPGRPPPPSSEARCHRLQEGPQPARAQWPRLCTDTGIWGSFLGLVSSAETGRKNGGPEARDSLHGISELRGPRELTGHRALRAASSTKHGVWTGTPHQPRWGPPGTRDRIRSRALPLACTQRVWTPLGHTPIATVGRTELPHSARQHSELWGAMGHSSAREGQEGARGCANPHV